MKCLTLLLFIVTHGLLAQTIYLHCGRLIDSKKDIEVMEEVGLVMQEGKVHERSEKS
ncbi:MAG: hypothetical protein AAF944_09170 [Bacteroidota bacterium]